MKRGVALSIFAALVAVTACGDDDDTTAPPPVSKIVTFKATLSGANEVPANTTSGSGTFTATLDTSTNLFTYDVTYTGLSANVTLGHIHGPALSGANAGTTINFAGGTVVPNATFVIGATSGAAHGSLTLNSSTSITTAINGDSLKKLLFAGLTYANIHTSAFGAGEIRGQITKQ